MLAAASRSSSAGVLQARRQAPARFESLRRQRWRAGARAAATNGPANAPNPSSGSSPRPLRTQAIAQPFGAVPSDVASAEELQPASSWSALMNGYYKLFRGWNALPSLMLVLLGAWTGAGKTVFALKHFTVWFMGVASASVALASCAINDYFDWKLDALNDSTKPIPSGLIAPDRALLVAALVYICLLAFTCVVPNAGVRLTISASAAATVLYTPVIKRHLFAKNLVVAATIAAAPLAGALAAGAAGPGLRAVLAPTSFLFLGILYREIMMDIQDRNGDEATGVRTLPVVAGPRAALGTCAALLAACLALSAHAALAGQGLAWVWAARPALEAYARVAALVAVAWNMANPAAAAVAVWRSGFSKEQVSVAINQSMPSIALGTLLLALLI